MHPILHLDLPSLSAPLETELLKQVHDLELTSIGVTMNAIELEAAKHNDVDTLSKIANIKSIYHFKFLPKHLKKIISAELEQQVRAEIGHELPQDIDFEIQAVTADSFPFDSFVHHDGNHAGARRVGWYYLLSASQACTSFYTSDQPPTYGLVWHPEHVTEVATQTMQPHNWYSFNHNSIHAVKNVDCPRHALVINLSRSFGSYELCMEKFKHLVAK